MEKTANTCARNFQDLHSIRLRLFILAGHHINYRYKYIFYVFRERLYV